MCVSFLIRLVFFFVLTAFIQSNIKKLINQLSILWDFTFLITFCFCTKLICISNRPRIIFLTRDFIWHIKKSFIIYIQFSRKTIHNYNFINIITKFIPINFIYIKKNYIDKINYIFNLPLTV